MNANDLTYGIEIETIAPDSAVRMALFFGYGGDDEDRLRLVQRPGHDDPRLPTQAVDRLG